MKSNDNTVLVTGGATGIGLAIAVEMLKRGNTVISCGRRSDVLEDAVKQFPGLVVHQCDLLEPADRSVLIEWLRRNHPGVNILINNAGVQRQLDFAHRSPDVASVASEIGTNLLAPILLTGELLPLLRSNSHSAIVNVSSGLAFCPVAEVPVYSATKAGMHSFTLSLRHQLRNAGVRVVELIPPVVNTALISGRIFNGETPVMDPEAFASEAIQRFMAGEDEIAVGMANGLRVKREAMFSVVNGG